MKVLSPDDPSPLDKIPMSKNDGTLRFFLSLSDEADDGQSSEDLAKIAKVEPSGNVTILEDDGFQNMPLGIVEQKLGVDPLSEDNEEQLKILAFIKKQTSYGEEFRNKFRNFPEEFYEAIDREGHIVFEHHLDESGNYRLLKFYLYKKCLF